MNAITYTTLRITNLLPQHIGLRAINAKNGKTLRGCQIYSKRLKSVMEVFKRCVIIHVIGINVGNQRNMSGKFNETAVRLIRFCYIPLSLTHLNIRSPAIHNAAINDCRIKSCNF